MVENKLDFIFKAYDVRGIYGETLTNEIAYNIGTAFSQFVESETIIVGHDGRNSNDVIFQCVAAGILSCLLYTSPSPRDLSTSRMPSSA